MNTQTRYAVYSLAAVVVLLTLLLAFPEVNRSTARAHAAGPMAESVAWTPLAFEPEHVNACEPVALKS
jgi:hypothetical protein